VDNSAAQPTLQQGSSATADKLDQGTPPKGRAGAAGSRLWQQGTSIRVGRGVADAVTEPGQADRDVRLGTDDGRRERAGAPQRDAGLGEQQAHRLAESDDFGVHRG
jgi:hypothetical protein